MIRWHAAIVDHQQLRHEQTPLSSPSTSSGPSRDLVRPRVVMPSTLGANGPILFCLHIKAPQSRLPLPYRGFPQLGSGGVSLRNCADVTGAYPAAPHHVVLLSGWRLLVVGSRWVL